jgi:hypothetical protein
MLDTLGPRRTEIDALALVIHRTDADRFTPRARAKPWLAMITSLVLVWGLSVHAQSTAYDPYATGAQNGTGANGYGNSTGTSGLSSGMPQSGGSQQGAGSGGAQGSSQSDSFSPVVIPNSSNQNFGDVGGQAPAANPVANPTDGSNSGPLYVRPGSQPGQFELFQRPPPVLNEFEKFVSESVGRPLPRFGSALILTRARGFALAATATVPPDYTLNPGDQLMIGITGSVEASLRLTIDSEGRIFIPRIGAVNVAGVRYGDLAAAISRRIDEQYKRAKVSVVISHLHGLNIYVTGYAVSPGAYTVSSLSTMVDAVLAAGGPSAGGSFRIIQLRRNGQVITTLDLYDQRRQDS